MRQDEAIKGISTWERAKRVKRDKWGDESKLVYCSYSYVSNLRKNTYLLTYSLRSAPSIRLLCPLFSVMDH